MQGLRAYLLIRSLLVGRLLREVGWVRLLLLAPMLAAVVGRALFMAAGHPQGRWAVPFAVVLLLGSAHRQRTDLRFLAGCALHYRHWLAAEYGLWALPAATVLAFFSAWGAAALTLCLAPLAAWAPAASHSDNVRTRISGLVRSEAFEWVSGLRAGGAWAWPVLLAGALWWHDMPLAPVFGLVGWLFVVVSCYGVPEPLTMLAVGARSPRQVLRRPLLLGLTYAALTAAPFWWLLAAGPVGVAGAVAVAAIWLGTVALLIMTKYAFYPNATHIRTTQGLLVSIALLLPGNPVYPVLLLVAAGGLAWQSQRRLAAILGAQQPQQHA
ncbi:MAG TPA: hypothetical protein VF629_17225 [Hymenobacter sp.]|jgi:hypothetical protein|uniref:hypothetical protein n=1 Tax=Hymenobacter sp. TaxID=1898978 RepID=UPI002EDA486B